jgi:hypothetical protein
MPALSFSRRLTHSPMFDKTWYRLQELATPDDLGVRWKVYACTVGTILIVGVSVVMAMVQGQLPKPNFFQGFQLLIGTATVGAGIGVLLAVKDYVHSRIANQIAVSLPLRLAFGFGIFSLLLFWIPCAITITFVAVCVIMA